MLGRTGAGAPEEGRISTAVARTRAGELPGGLPRTHKRCGSSRACHKRDATLADDHLRPFRPHHGPFRNIRRVSCRLASRLLTIGRKPGWHLPDARLTVFWNPDGAALQCGTYPAQESLLRSFCDDRRATDADQSFNRVLSLHHLPEPLTPL